MEQSNPVNNDQHLLKNLCVLHVAKDFIIFVIPYHSPSSLVVLDSFPVYKQVSRKYSLD